MMVHPHSLYPWWSLSTVVIKVEVCMSVNQKLSLVMCQDIEVSVLFFWLPKAIWWHCSVKKSQFVLVFSRLLEQRRALLQLLPAALIIGWFGWKLCWKSWQGWQKLFAIKLFGLCVCSCMWVSASVEGETSERCLFLELQYTTGQKFYNIQSFPNSCKKSKCWTGRG